MEQRPDRSSHSAEPSPRPWRTRPASMFIATVGGLGHLPLAPGTWGAVAALPVLVLAVSLPLVVRLGLLAGVIFVAIPAATRAGRLLGDHDSCRIVVDEFVGMWATLVWVGDLDGPTLAAGFLAFRAFDILKPPGARWCHHARTDGLGVVGDDLAAAIWAGGTVFTLRLLM